MSRKLYNAVVAELRFLELNMWYTPYLGERAKLLNQLKTNLEQGDPTLAADEESRYANVSR